MKKVMGKEDEEEGEVTVGNHRTSSSSSSSSLSYLTTLSICHDKELKSISEFENVFEMRASSLQRLTILGCRNLTRFSKGLQHLTALQSLELGCNHQLNFSEDGNEDIMPWKPLHQSLPSLTFRNFKSMRSLPEGMQYLTSLQTLNLLRCEKLNGLPEWISCLSSLQSLTIKNCSAIESLLKGIQKLTSLQNLTIRDCGGLHEHCRKHSGQDWPKIKHIPNVRACMCIICSMHCGHWKCLLKLGASVPSNTVRSR